MRTRHEAVIPAAPEAVFALAAAVESWTALHPAYRWCRVLERAPDVTVFEMGGRIRGWPARWMARQERFPREGRIVFRHIAGLTRGMVVQWTLTPAAAGTRVVIDHDLTLPWPILGRAVADLVVGPIFIDWIAARTLEGVRRVLEAR
ncbi:MAG TPA: SRPBCC family protein [bacterium]|nr:SRPBCC family protein [bacterium]